MTARVELSRTAAASLRMLRKGDRRLFDRVVRALKRLALDPQLGKALQGQLSGRRSHRVGPLRIIYRFDSGRVVVFVLDIGERGKIYR